MGMGESSRLGNLEEAFRHCNLVSAVALLCGSFPSSGWTNMLLLGATAGDRQRPCGVTNDLLHYG